MSDPHERRFDVRLIEARIRRGAVEPGEYAKYLDALPDDSVEAEPCKTQFTASFAAAHYRKA